MIRIACAIALTALLALAGPADARIGPPRPFARGGDEVAIVAHGSRFLAYQTTGEYGAISSLNVGSGLVSWSTFEAAYTYEIKRRRLREWRFPELRLDSIFDHLTVAHTARAVLFRVPVDGGYEILRSRR